MGTAKITLMVNTDRDCKLRVGKLVEVACRVFSDVDVNKFSSMQKGSDVLDV